MSKRRTVYPSLLVLNGEAPGRMFELKRDVTVIGRSPKCEVVLSRISVSRRHAQILRVDPDYYFEDLGSDSGSRVDGKPAIGRVLLRDGSLIEVSKYFLSFTDPSFRINDSSQSVILGQVELPSSSDDHSFSVKPEEKLRHVLEISRNLADSLHLDLVLSRTLEALFNIFPQADRAFVILKEGDEMEETPRAIKFRGGQQGDLTISRTVFELVMNAGKAILSSDVANDSRLNESESVAHSQIRTMLCVPLLDQQRQPRGVLQIDTQGDRRRFQQDDLDILAAVAVLVGVAVENARLHAAMIARTEMEVEERDARQVQMAFLPNERPVLDGYDFWHHYEPALFVGGDYFDYIAVPQQQPDGQTSRWVIVLGDVVGKGMPAALLMARLSAEVRFLVLSGLEPAAIVERLNHDFARAALEHRFITFLLVMLDGKNQEMTVVNAGHMGPLVRRANGTIEVIGESATEMPIGIDEQIKYRPAAAALDPGDVVVLYTDGVNEALDAAGRPLGSDRLKRLVSSTSGSSTAVGEAILKAVRDHVGDRARNDDLTLLCFSRL